MHSTWSKSSRILLQHVSKWKVDVNYLWCICKHILYGLLIGFNKIFITKLQAVYMGFLNYNIIFDIDISNYETDYTKIRHDFWSRGVVLEFSNTQSHVSPLSLRNRLVLKLSNYYLNKLSQKCTNPSHEWWHSESGESIWSLG